MKRLLVISLICITLFSAFRSFAEDSLYSYTQIPQSLITGADAVIRYDHMYIRIVSLNEIYVTEDYAVTVLNENGKKYAAMERYYDKFRSIEKVNGWLYDSNGIQVRQLKNNEIKDQVTADENLIDNARYKKHEFDFAVYPYTCEYHVEEKYTYSFFLPSFSPQFNSKCALEKANLSVEYPPTVSLRYHTFNIDKSLQSQPGELTLSLSNIPAQKKEDNFMPGLPFSSPLVIFATDSFLLGDIAGNMATWQNLSKFGYTLNKDRDALPDDVKKTVHALTDTCSSPYQKINLLYEYMKKNTRYVSIQLGIGGWQTLDAKFVASKGYGDCKALSNYMKALLKEAGITSYQAWVYAGQDDMLPVQKSFPFNHFNHVILCVPVNADTIWVECTAKDLPAGYLSSFTSNRNVLLLTPIGSSLVRTPTYGLSESYEYRKAIMNIDSNGGIQGYVDLTYSGSLWDKEERYISHRSKTTVEDHLNSKFNLPDYLVGSYKFTDEKNGKLPLLHEHISLTGTDNVTHAGKRLFIATGTLPIRIEKPSSYEERKDSFKIKYSFQITDTMDINVNGNYVSEYIPGDINMDFPFAAYHSKLLFENNTLKLVVNYLQKEGVYPPDLFQEYIRLSKEINNHDNNDKVVLVKKQ